MTKFWYVVTAIFLVAVGLLGFAQEDRTLNRINFDDLETECRYDRATESIVDLNRDDSLRFEGYFPTESPEADVEYTYSQTNSSVTLNIYARNSMMPVNFWNNCLASVVYSSETEPLGEGTYLVTVKHDGETVDKKVIKIS